MNGDLTMITTTHRRPLAIGSVVAVFLLAAVAWTALLTSGVDETHTVQPVGEVTRIEVDIDAGAITLAPADELTVTVRQQAGRFAGTPSAATQVVDGVLRVTGSCSSVGVGRCHTPVTVATPPGITVRARAAAGSIDGELVRGRLEASTAAGSITLTVTGEVSDLMATTEAGRIDLIVPDDVYAVDARTTLGRTRVEVDTADDSPKVIKARSEVGRITIRTRQDTP